MSIASVISGMQTAISSAYSAVQAKGGTVPTVQTLNALPTAIQGIPSGGGTDSRYKQLLERIGNTFEDSTASMVGDYACAGWAELEIISLPNCTSLGHYAFYGCYNIPSIFLPECIEIGVGCFATEEFNYILSSANLPKCKKLYWNAFENCPMLEYISLPVCSYIGQQCFLNAWTLRSISLPSCTYIGNLAFRYAYDLSIVYIGTSNCTLQNSNVFSETAILSHKGSIYVPSAYVNTYKTSTNWAYFSNRIFGY